MSKAPNEDDEAVGYGRPPKSKRFRRGASGNPRGRPKRTRNIATELRAELDAKVTVKENGTTVQLTKGAALAKSIVARALSGNMRAFDVLLRVLPERFATLEDPKAQPDLTAEEHPLIRIDAVDASQ